MTDEKEHYVDAIRSDSWQNFITGLGTLWDKGRWTIPRNATFLDTQSLEAMFYNDWIAGAIVEDPVKAAFRQGVDIIQRPYWETSDRSGGSTWVEPDPDTSRREAIEIEELLKKHNWIDQIKKLITFGRLYGRQGLLIGADDHATDLTEPLEESEVSDLFYLEELDCDDFNAGHLADDHLAANFGEPETWLLFRGSGVGPSQEVHESRVLLAGGATTSKRKRRENQWRDASVLQRVITELQRFNTDNMSVSAMMQDASLGILAIENFVKILSGNDKDTLKDRMDIFDRCKVVSRTVPIDAERETFTWAERSFTGVKDMLEKRQQFMSGAAHMPSVILFGREPAGLSATGDADIRAWYDTVAADRDAKYTPILEKLVRIAAYALGATNPEAWGIEWPSLWQESPKEKAERQKLVAESDAVYVDRGVVDADELAMARFGSGTWSDEAPQVDMESRDEMREQDRQVREKELETTNAPPSTDPQSGEEKIQQQALNGAQVTAMREIVEQVVVGMLPRESAIEMIVAAFPVDRQIAEKILGKVGKSFKPDPMADVPGMDDPKVKTKP